MSSFVIKSIGNVLNTTSLVSPGYASKKALKLFATPRKGKYSEKQRLVVDSAFFQELKHKNLNIATYRWIGKGKKVLLAHGWESNASRWHYLLEDLKAQDCDIMALDAPAHGRSDGKEFNALLYSEFINVVAQNFKPEIMVGHSVGGMASVFGMHHYDLPFVKKLALLGAPAHFKGVFSRYKDMMGFNSRISNGLDKIVLDRFGKPVTYFSAAKFSESLDCEGLIVHDKKDRIIPFEDALMFSKYFENSKLVSTSGLGHGLKDPSITPQLIAFMNT